MQSIKRSSPEIFSTRTINFGITRDMTQTMSFMVGALLVLTGLSEIFVPQFVEMNLSILHSVFIAGIGGALIYSGFKDNSRFAYVTCLISGLVFAVFSVIGFVFGERTNAFVRYDATDDHLLNLPGLNALGTFDHGVHAVLGLVLLLGALDWYRHHRADEIVRDSTDDLKFTPASWGRE